jgi:hypothetical protein
MEAKSLDLEKFLQFAPPTGSICTVYVKNKCPQDWGIVIIEAGARFFNRDGTDFFTGTIPMNLPSGAQDQLSSNDPAKCVLTVIGAVKITEPGQPEQILTATSNSRPNECGVGVNFTIGPKAFVLNEENRKSLGLDISQLIEMNVSY